MCLLVCYTNYYGEMVNGDNSLPRRERIFRFLNIFIEFLQLNEDEKCRQFIHHRDRRKKFILHI